MIVTLEEMKQYLRVDFDDDDSLIETLITSATRLCMDITRQNEDVFEGSENAKPAVFYAVAYLYEHREEADHHALTLTLRSLLFGSRKRRATALGRNNKQTQMRKLQIPTHFHMGEVTVLYDNPVKQAEYLYNLIESESK